MPLLRCNGWERISVKLARCKRESWRWQQAGRVTVQNSIQHLSKVLNGLNEEEDMVAGREAKKVQQELNIL